MKCLQANLAPPSEPNLGYLLQAVLLDSPVSDSLASRYLSLCCHCLLMFFSPQLEISLKAETKPLTSVAPAGHKGRAR